MNTRTTTRTVAAALALAGLTALATPAHADTKAGQLDGWATSSVTLYPSCGTYSGETGKIPQGGHFKATEAPRKADSSSDTCWSVTDDYGRTGYTQAASSIVTVPADPEALYSRWVSHDPAGAEAETGFFGGKAGDKVYDVHSGPLEDADVVATLAEGQTVRAGIPVDISGASWVPVQVDGEAGFVQVTAVKPADGPGEATASATPTTTPEATAPAEGQATAAPATTAAPTAPAAEPAAASEDVPAAWALAMLPGGWTPWGVAAAGWALWLGCLAVGRARRRAASRRADAPAAPAPAVAQPAPVPVPAEARTMISLDD
ncbi:hypothetical protein [Sinomonas halotolerans]|uniref:SH3 domain-containing protein n=1 Tax=Sinomonas halotolerans TaxID=1644133 RepID=A0ABU9WW12_9MICC